MKRVMVVKVVLQQAINGPWKRSGKGTDKTKNENTTKKRKQNKTNKTKQNKKMSPNETM